MRFTNKMFLIIICIFIVSGEKATGNSYGNQNALQDTSERFHLRLKHSDFNGFKSYLADLLNKWKKIPIHIGITGGSGVGKSTFINTIRGLQAGDQHAAPVGVDETTKTIAPYPDTSNSKLIYWDLPGCGTLNFPRDTYLKTVNFTKFDVMILITSTRFTENDKWLTNKAKTLSIPLLLVRNKIDIDLNNERQDHPSRSEQDIMKTIRNDMISQVDDRDVSLYLISARRSYYSFWDFPNLVEDLMEETPKVKQQAFIFSIASYSKAIVELKVQALRERVWITATLSAAANVLPIPGVSVILDFKLLEDELEYYQKALALDIDSLTSLIKKNGKAMDGLMKYFKSSNDRRSNYQLIIGKEAVAYLVGKIGTSGITEPWAAEMLKYIPFVGQGLSSTASFSMTYMMLNNMLDDLHIVANGLSDFIKSDQNSD